MRISGVESTDLFVGTAARPLQVVRVHLSNTGPDAASDTVLVEVHGPVVSTPVPARVSGLLPGADITVEVGVQVDAPAQPGTPQQILVRAEGPAGPTEQSATMTMAEPGWVMWMVSHFHYDPVWWNTQGRFLQSWQVAPSDTGELPEVRNAFELVALHLEAARRDPDYKFVLAEIDYLKPHFDAHPEDRADLLDFIKAGRIELVGGSYNEPNTNLTGVESTIRNAGYGLAYQRDVLGGRPTTAWMLDAFGFDPGYPGVMAAAGLTESSWARGPFHQWGPKGTVGSNTQMQFGSEFEWLSPDGNGLLTGYMANHYSAGWLAGHHAKTVEEAEAHAYQQFAELKPVATTRNVLLPVGGDHVIPPRWATPIHRDWNARYVWPRFTTAVPSEFFAAVRSDAAERGIWITPQTRDMNPVYTGKDVSYIDTKQGQRAVEVAVLDAERLATLAWLSGAPYPAVSLDKAWRLLAFGAHHDAITGTEGDQTYLDLLGGWREAWERGEGARRDAVAHLSQLADTASLPGARAGDLAVVVVNSLSLTRSAMATIRLELPAGWPGWMELLDDTGTPVPFLAEAASHSEDGSLTALTVTFRANNVPGVGFRSYLVRPAPVAPALTGWQLMPSGPVIENEALLAEADPERGGTLSRVTDKRTGTELLTGPGNEMLLQPEHAAHPRWAEGPWLLCPAGPAAGSADQKAIVRAERSPVGGRLVGRFVLGDLQITQEALLWDGADRLELRTHVDGSIGQDHLLRVRFPTSVAGGLPVYQTAVAVVGRPPGETDVDVAEHWFTLDNPASEWVAVGSTARIARPDGVHQAIGVAEVICPPELRDGARDLLVALAREGVTATCSLPTGPRYGNMELDSNLPDFRISIGGPEVNEFTAAVMSAAGQEAAAALAASGRVWLPAQRSRADAFAPGADVRGAGDLPVLVVAADALAGLTADLADAVIDASGPAGGGAGGPSTALAPHTVALLNRGTPSALVTPDGALTMSLMRACSTWPCGIWMDGPRRATPDGSSFAWQHWSHTFEYALMAGTGDWRSAGFAAAGHDYNHDLLTVTTDVHEGALPAAAALLTVRPETALISTLKPYGNPLVPAARPGPGVTLRLRDIGGRGAQEASVRLAAGVAGANTARICEDGTGEALPVHDGTVAMTVPAAGLATAMLTPGAAAPFGAVGSASTDAPESVNPVYARYWLHGKGPAPAGNMPISVHLSPGAPGAPLPVRLTVACGPQAASGTVELDVPAGVTVTPAGPLAYDLPPLGYSGWDLEVHGDQAAGRRFLTARISGPDGLVIEDSVPVTGGDDNWEAEADIGLATTAITLRPGETGPVELRFTSRCDSLVRGEAQLLSPYGSWDQAGPWTTAFSAQPGETLVVPFEVAAAATARPGQRWWAIVKVMYFGRVRYTEPIEVTIA
jgi:alpha-mannosidase